MSFFKNQSQPSSVFSNPLNPASGSNTASTQPFGTAKPATNIFGNPTGTPATGGSVFGNARNAPNNAATASSTAPASSGGGIFGNIGTTTANPTTLAGSSLFGGGSSATSAPTPAGTTPSTFGGPAKPPGSLFGGGSNVGATSTTPANTSLFGNAPTSSNVFTGGSGPTPSASKPTDSTGNAPKPNLFGAPATAPAATGSSTPGTGLFGLPPKPTENTTAAASGSTMQPITDTSSTSTGTAGTTTGGASLFGGGNLFGKAASASTTSTTPTATSATGMTTAPPGGLFGPKVEEKKDGAASSFNLFGVKKDTPANDKPSTPTTNTIPVVAVPPPSVLRGKTLEEIVNRWSSDLETQVREFNRYAAEVAVWDRALIENGNNLTALYSHITAAERQQDNIDQSLNHIEQQQKDLVVTLDAYEKMSQELLGGQNGNLRTLDTGPADTERDKNYMLATDLHTQLDDLSGSLTQMIDAVNSLSVSSKPTGGSNDDPMTQISQILSSHLESLQWIDGAVREVEGKVSDIEKRVKDSGHNLTGSTNQGRSRGFGLNR